MWHHYRCGWNRVKSGHHSFYDGNTNAHLGPTCLSCLSYVMWHIMRVELRDSAGAGNTRIQPCNLCLCFHCKRNGDFDFIYQIYSMGTARLIDKYKVAVPLLCTSTILYSSLCLTSTLVVTSHESNVFSMSASFAFSWSCPCGITHTQVVRRYIRVANTERHRSNVTSLSNCYTLLTLKYKVKISTHKQKSPLHATFCNNKNGYFCIWVRDNMRK